MMTVSLIIPSMMAAVWAENANPSSNVWNCEFDPSISNADTTEVRILRTVSPGIIFFFLIDTQEGVFSSFCLSSSIGSW